MPRVALRLAYDGTNFLGWQRLARGPTVQAAIEEAFARAFSLRVRVAGAGRTDAGVHATGQVAALDLPPRVPIDAIAPALARHLPDAIRVLEAAAAPDDFDPRRDAVRRRYRYRMKVGGTAPVLERTFVAHCRPPIPRAHLSAATEALARADSLVSLVPARYAEEAAQRTFEVFRLARVRGAEGYRYEWIVEARAFLHHQVRTMVGTVIEAARRAENAWEAKRCVRDVLAAKDRRAAPAPAPARGLVLEAVEYPAERDPFRRRAKRTGGG